MSNGKGFYNRDLSESLPEFIGGVVAKARGPVVKIWNKAKLPVLIGCLLFTVVGIVAFICWYRDPLHARFVSTSVEQIDATDMEAKSPDMEAKPGVPDPGQTITIFNPKGNPVGVTRTVEDFHELQKALTAHDEPGLTELTSSNRAYLVSSGTQAMFLDYGDGWSAPYEVRILSGEHAGERAFVYHGSVTK